ncbi:MAG TPA: hypothetical protein VLK33_09325, partial [Terriglobales bacterium]|nr:hypothetical protein [Terriglobales bacterium]
VPAGTSIDNQANAIFDAGSSLNSVSNTVHVIAQPGTNTGSILTISKSASKTTANPGDQITYTLNLSNTSSGDPSPVSVTIDGTAASKIVLQDVIPNNTQFTAVTATGPATPVYHAVGAPALTYTSVPPSSLANVDAIAFVLDTFVTGTNASFSFQVAINSSAAGTVRNTGTVFYNTGADTFATSNEVDITVNGPPPSIAYYFDNNFNKTIQATSITSPLWVQVSAAGCNLDPATAETKLITLTSTLTGDTETFTATESGPNTGIFRILPAPPMRDASSNTVVSGDKIMEVLHNDQLVASMSGCGATNVTAKILIDPAGVVFDSHTNATIAGATVQLIDVTGGGNGGSANSPASVFQFDGTTAAPSSVITGADGRFQFPQVLPSTYKITVTPPANYKVPSTVAPAQLPAGRHIDASASYNGSFVISSSTSSVNFDVPADATSTTTFFIQKTVDRVTVEQGDFINYTVEVKNLLSTTVPQVQVVDTLPPGFAYQLKTARVNGAA